MFKFSLTDESCSDSQGQGNIHHYGVSKKPKNQICPSEGLLSFTGGLGQSHKVICSCRAALKRESKGNKV